MFPKSTGQGRRSSVRIRLPIFVNTYLPPLPKPRHCEALGKAILKVIEKRGEKVAIIASGGMSHYPGTWKYLKTACSE